MNKAKKLKKQREKIVNLLLDGDYWNPHFTDIAKVANAPITTVRSVFQKMLHTGVFTTTIEWVEYFWWDKNKKGELKNGKNRRNRKSHK